MVLIAMEEKQLSGSLSSFPFFLLSLSFFSFFLFFLFLFLIVFPPTPYRCPVGHPVGVGGLLETETVK